MPDADKVRLLSEWIGPEWRFCANVPWERWDDPGVVAFFTARIREKLPEYTLIKRPDGTHMMQIVHNGRSFGSGIVRDEATAIIDAAHEYVVSAMGGEATCLTR